MLEDIHAVDLLIDLLGRHRKRRLTQYDPAVRHIGQQAQLLADALRQHGAAAQAERHIGTQFKSHLAQLVVGQTGCMQCVERTQHSRRIRRAARQTCRNRNALFDVNLAGFEQCAGLLVEQLRRTVRQIALIGRQKRQAAAQHDAARLFLAVDGGNAHGIVQRDRLHDHLHRVVAVLPPSGDVERQVDLCTGTNSRIRVCNFLFSSKKHVVSASTFISVRSAPVCAHGTR